VWIRTPKAYASIPVSYVPDHRPRPAIPETLSYPNGMGARGIPHGLAANLPGRGTGTPLDTGARQVPGAAVGPAA
jgi:hypothetical protein